MTPANLSHGPRQDRVASISTLIPSQILKGIEENAQLELYHAESSHGNNTFYIPRTKRITVTWLYITNVFIEDAGAQQEAPK